MAKLTSTLQDFIAETNGSCFLCPNKTSSAKPPSIYSLHCLVRYLRMDMKKVFTGNDPIPPHLLERVQKSRLKVELCEKCAALIGNFSKLFRQLEKTEIEITSCLDIIHGKLEAELKFAKRDKAAICNSQDQWHAKLEIAEALRKDAMQKCSRKLRTVLPLSKLERLTFKQINAEKVKIKSTNQNSVEYYESIYDDNGMESPIPEVMSDFIDGNDYYDAHSRMLEENGCIEELGPRTEMKQEMTPDTTHDNMQIKGEEDTEHHPQASRTGNQSKFVQILKSTEKRKVKNMEAIKLAQSIPPPIKVSSGDGNVPKSVQNPIAHLKMKFKCSVCRKDSNTKQHYENHYLSVHMGVKFKCGKCNKTFSNESNLAQHQKSVHLGIRFQCKFCSKTFPKLSIRSQHTRSCPEKKIHRDRSDMSQGKSANHNN